MTMAEMPLNKLKLLALMSILYQWRFPTKTFILYLIIHLLLPL